MKNVAFGLMGVGALLLLLGVSVWGINKPDFAGNFVRTANSVNRAVGGASPDFQRKQVEEARANGERMDGIYRGCLFSSYDDVCRSVAAVPYINIAGVLMLLAGIGLFGFGRMAKA